MQSLEAKCEEGVVSSILQESCSQKLKANMVCTNTRTFKKAKTSSSIPLQAFQDTVPTDISTYKPQFCIHTKLKELHKEECAKDPNLKETGLKYNSYLLEKLVAKERLNTLILNLYADNEGYSLTCPIMPNSEIVMCKDYTANSLASITWPYEMEELLRYIDNEELPAYFIDKLEPHQTFLFYSGCIILQIKNYRHHNSLQNLCDIQYVLLKPNLRSILADVEKLRSENERWNTNDILQCESEILKANYPNLCLDNDYDISVQASKYNHNSKLFSTRKMRRWARKQSQLVINRKKRLLLHSHRKEFDFLNKINVNNRRFNENHHFDTTHSLPLCETPPSSAINIDEISRLLKRLSEKFKEIPRQVCSDWYPQLVEKYVLETESSCKNRIYHIKLSILQRPSNGEYLGELYLDRDYKENQKNGVACTFSLGTRVYAARYIQQFTEIFREGGRKLVRISYYQNSESKNQDKSQSQATSRPANGTYIQQHSMVPNAAHQYEAKNVKPQQQNRSITGHSTIINLLNSSTVNNECNATVTNQRKPNNRLTHLSGQTITLTSVSSAHNNHTTLPALLATTPAADREIVGSGTNALLIDKRTSNSLQSQLAGLHTQNAANTISFAQLSARTPGGMQHLQLQRQLPISLTSNVTSTGSLQGHPTNLLVSVPVSTGASTSTSFSSGITVAAASTVVLVNAGTNNIAQIVTSRNASQPGVNLTQRTQTYLPRQQPGVQRQTRPIKMATTQLHFNRK